MSEHNHVRPARSQMDIHQIFKHVMDDSTGALRTIPSTNSSFEISLNAKDDSITAERKELLITAEKTDAVSCIGIKTICLYIKSGTVSIQISPLDEGDDWYALSLTSIEPKEICARRIRMSTSQGAEASLVGQG